jgi:hypothetical protein
MKKTQLLGALCTCIATLGISSANASIVVNIIESGVNVEASYSGSLDLGVTTGSWNPNSAAGPSGYATAFGSVWFPNANHHSYSTTISSWTPFGTGPNGAWDTSNGDAFVMYSNFKIGVPSGYISGDNISGNATKLGSSFASLGFTPGSYVSTLTNGSFTDSITINVSAVPIPAAAWLFGSGLLGLIGVARRKKA